MQTNNVDDAANSASLALLELRNNSAKLAPINLEPVSVVIGLPGGIHTAATKRDTNSAHYPAAGVHKQVMTMSYDQDLAIFEVGFLKYTMRKELIQIGRNSSKGNVDIDVTQSDSSAVGFVSRIHCEVRYDPKTRQFYLSCNGKNGVFVDDIIQRHGDTPVQLRRCCILTFPSTKISVRFTSLITNTDQPLNTNGVSHDSHFAQQPSLYESKTNGDVINADLQKGSWSSSRKSTLTDAVNIPESDVKFRHSAYRCDTSQRAAATVATGNQSQANVASCVPIVNELDAYSSAATMGGRASLNTNSCPVSPHQSNSMAQALLSVVRNEFSTSKHGAFDAVYEQPTSLSTQGVFRQPVNGCCSKTSLQTAALVHNLASNSSVDASHPATTDTGDRERGSKPPYSYAQLIAQAIASVPQRQLTLSGIYAFITKNYPYFHANDKGWQNSIRHNLSLNRFFVKVPRSHEEPGKGMFWRIESEYEDKLIASAYRRRRQRSANSGTGSGSGSSTPRRNSTKPLKNGNGNGTRGFSSKSVAALGFLDPASSNSNSASNAEVPSRSHHVTESTLTPTPTSSSPHSPPAVVKSPQPFTATLTASSCSSRNTSPTCENELIGVGRPFGVFPLGACKSVSLPHSPVTTFLIDELKQRSVDNLVHSGDGDMFSCLSHSSMQLQQHLSLSARSTPATPITAKKSPLTLPNFTSQSPIAVACADKQQQQQHQLALFIANRQNTQSQLNGRTQQVDTLTPPNSASSSNCRGSSCAFDSGFPSAKTSLSDVPNSCCGAQLAVVVDPQLQLKVHSFLQQSSSMQQTNALLLRQYSMPVRSTEHAADNDVDGLDRGVANGKRPHDALDNGKDEAPLKSYYSNSCATRIGDHGIPLKKRCYFKPEVEQNEHH